MHVWDKQAIETDWNLARAVEHSEQSAQQPREAVEDLNEVAEQLKQAVAQYRM